MGNLDEAAKIGDELGFREPLNDRAAFNRGWYEIRRGNLLDGHKLIFRGRHESVFGNPPPKVPTPMWDGVSKGTDFTQYGRRSGRPDTLRRYDPLYGQAWL